MTQNLNSLVSQNNKHLSIIDHVMRGNKHLASVANDMKNVATNSPGALEAWANTEWRNNKQLKQIISRNNLQYSNLNLADNNGIKSYAAQVSNVANENNFAIADTKYKYARVSQLANNYSTASNHMATYNRANSYVSTHDLDQNANWLRYHASFANSYLHLADNQTASNALSETAKINTSVDKELGANKSMAVSSLVNSTESKYVSQSNKLAKAPSNAIYWNADDNLTPLNNNQIQSMVSKATNQNAKYVKDLSHALGVKPNLNRRPLSKNQQFWNKLQRAEQEANVVPDSNNILNINDKLYFEKPKAQSQNKRDNEQNKTNNQEQTNTETKSNQLYQDPVMKSYNKLYDNYVKTHGDNISTQNIIDIAEKAHALTDNNIAKGYLHYGQGIDSGDVNYLINRGLVRGLKGDSKHPAKVEFMNRLPKNAKVANSLTPNDNKTHETFMDDLKLDQKGYKAPKGKQEERLVGANYLDVKPGKIFKDSTGKAIQAYDSTGELHTEGRSNFNFRIGSGKKNLCIFNNAKDAISYVGIHQALGEYSNLHDTLFVSANNNSNIKEFVEDQFPTSSQFKNITVCAQNNVQGHKLIDQMANQFGNKINVETPVTNNRNIADLSKLDSKTLNQSWSDELKHYTLDNRQPSKVGTTLSVAQYRNDSVKRAMKSISTDDMQKLDIMARVSADLQKGNQSFTGRTPKVRLVNKLNHQLTDETKKTLANLNISQNLSAKDLAKDTNKILKGKNPLRDNDKIKEAQASNPDMLKTTEHFDKQFDKMVNPEAQKLYATALGSTATVWRRFMHLYQHDVPAHRQAYNEAHPNTPIKQTDPKVGNLYKGQIAIASAVRRASYDKLIKNYPRDARLATKISPTLKDLRNKDLHRKTVPIDFSNVSNDIVSSWVVNDYLDKKGLKPYSAKDMIGAKSFNNYKTMIKQGKYQLKNNPIPRDDHKKDVQGSRETKPTSQASQKSEKSVASNSQSSQRSVAPSSATSESKGASQSSQTEQQNNQPTILEAENKDQKTSVSANSQDVDSQSISSESTQSESVNNDVESSANSENTKNADSSEAPESSQQSETSSKSVESSQSNTVNSDSQSKDSSYGIQSSSASVDTQSSSVDSSVKSSQSISSNASEEVPSSEHSSSKASKQSSSTSVDKSQATPSSVSQEQSKVSTNEIQSLFSSGFNRIAQSDKYNYANLIKDTAGFISTKHQPDKVDIHKNYRANAIKDYEALAPVDERIVGSLHISKRPIKELNSYADSLDALNIKPSANRDMQQSDSNRVSNSVNTQKSSVQSSETSSKAPSASSIPKQSANQSNDALNPNEANRNLNIMHNAFHTQQVKENKKSQKEALEKKSASVSASNAKSEEASEKAKSNSVSLNTSVSSSGSINSDAQPQSQSSEVQSSEQPSSESFKSSSVSTSKSASKDTQVSDDQVSKPASKQSSKPQYNKISAKQATHAKAYQKDVLSNKDKYQAEYLASNVLKNDKVRPKNWQAAVELATVLNSENKAGGKDYKTYNKKVNAIMDTVPEYDRKNVSNVGNYVNNLQNGDAYVKGLRSFVSSAMDSSVKVNQNPNKPHFGNKPSSDANAPQSSESSSKSKYASLEKLRKLKMAKQQRGQTR